MMLSFYKYHGAGNDFILVDNRNASIILSEQQIAFICNRHLGIGGDGLMMLSNKAGYDFAMTYYNSDGKEGSMCGNGGRCIVSFANYLNVIKDKAYFIAVDGEHHAFVTNTISNALWQVKLQMNDVNEIKTIGADYLMNTGSPHYITFVNDVKNQDVFNNGKRIRWDKLISEKGVNVNFVEERANTIFVRTFERGVEDETLSCGTGSIASAIAYSVKNNLDVKHVEVKTQGGDLKIYFNKQENNFTDIWLEGPAALVFKGEIDV